MTRRVAAWTAFTLSGAAGLVYETVWSRYLALWVGSSAYAQVLVLVVFLGGMALGSLAVAGRSERLERPLRLYAGVELLLALAGLLFHPVFELLTAFGYETLFPALGDARAVGAVRWGTAALLILGQSVLLGATFPLMVAGLVRTDPLRPGGGTADAYLANTLGGVAGVLLAGFWLVDAFGLPGALAAAALMNLLAAVAVLGLVEREAGVAPPLRAGVARGPAPVGTADGAGPGLALLVVSFGTALASFTYEIGWIRMLTLVLGGATRSFEVMLAAFLLGLALGARVVRGVSDRARDPEALLGVVQLCMGLAALASVPMYVVTFDLMASLLQRFPADGTGYALLNLSRFLLSVLVMLPATVLAGMTLPVITGALLRRGGGERYVGGVYAANTVGSVVGVALSGLVLLPALGLEGLLLAGAALDVALGVWLLVRAARRSGRGWGFPALSAAAAALAFLGVGLAVRLDPLVLGSGVFRYGVVPGPGERDLLFHGDGRSATVGVHRIRASGLVVLSTNGKPDASAGSRWLEAGEAREGPMDGATDYVTQVLSPLVALAHRPGAVRVANVGHGSGITGATLLTGPRVARVVTVEIEPLMVEASLVFLPVNAAVFQDPRSSFVLDDARAWFAYAGERLDLVLAEPSNPWVSGVSTLFTREFYGRAREVLVPGGVWAQWLQLYEFDDALFLSVLKAVDEAFDDWRVYLVGQEDVVMVASTAGPLPEPDWSVAASPGVAALLPGVPPFLPTHLEGLALFDRSAIAPLLERSPVPAHSDLRPLLESGADRARFLRTTASGVLSFARDRFDLARALTGARRLPGGWAPPPVTGLPPIDGSARRGWIGEAVAAGGGAAPPEFPEWGASLLELRNLHLSLQAQEPGAPWPTWAAVFRRVEEDLHRGTAGWADSAFYRSVHEALDRQEAPPPVRALVDFSQGVAAWDWPRAAAAADLLLAEPGAGAEWVEAGRLMDGAVVAYLRTGRTADAREALRRLEPLTGRGPGHLRTLLLEGWVAGAEEAGG